MSLEPWQIALAGTFVVGLAVLIWGHVHDRRRFQRRADELRSAPERPIPGLPRDAGIPTYVTAEEARTPPRPPIVTQTDLSAAVAVTARLAGPGFTQDGRTATLENPAVIVTDGDVTSFRMLLTPLERAARTATPLVLVARRFEPEVLATLEVNTIQQRLRLIAVSADDQARAQICELTGAAAMPQTDLQSGFLPDAGVGRCRAWSSTKDGSRIVLDQP